MSAEPNWEEINKDKEAKKHAVLKHITSKCTTTSEHEDLRNIAKSLSNGGTLTIEILTGGLANYSYKISCTDTNSGVEHNIFAKLSFPYAMLFPDKPCPLSRTENEFIMMKRFHELNPELVAIPFFCDNVGDDMKLLVTQWSRVDEQFGNQFIDGVVDPRTATRIAEGLSRLHCKKVESDELAFNIEMRPWFHSLVPILEEIVGGLYTPESDDRVAALARQLGEEETTAGLASYKSTIDDMECIVHGDCHLFNLMVGKKPSVETLENFDADGVVAFCDFEMSRGGIPATDVGPLRAFPIACAFAHALNGHRLASENCLDWLDSFWSTYEARARDAGVTSEQVTKTYRQALQYSALYLLAYYGIGVHMDHLPIDQDNTEDLERVKESVGLVGLKFLVWGMDDGISLEQMRSHCKQAVEEEINQLLAVKKVRRNRRSSMLRATGRRVSDANLHLRLDRNSFVSTASSRHLSEVEVRSSSLVQQHAQ